MQDRDPQNLNFYWSTLFVRKLYEQGINRVIISPGSRSTPLTLAFAAHPGFEKSIIIDERAAAFTALGMSKADRIPTCLVCTSGTAVANYLPAVIEASNSGVPLIILSADRPPNLRSIGASQTIDQLKIFGSYPVFFHEVGEPNESIKDISRLELLAKQAVDSSKKKAGVCHINFAFSKPFEPSVDFLEVVEQENEKHAKKKFQAVNIEYKPVELSQNFWNQISQSEYLLIIAGPDINSAIADSIQQIAKQFNAPILIEPGSNLPSTKYSITGFDGFLRNEEIVQELHPDLILRFGRSPVSKALTQYLMNYDHISQIVFHSDDSLMDESLSADEFIYVPSGITIPEIDNTVNKEWIRNWRRYQKDYVGYKERVMFPTSPLTDGYVFHIFSELIPSKCFIMLSNSFPVRDMALFGDYDGKEIYVNRGAAGIDGIISTTIGLSNKLRKQGVLFIGDIAFLHDSNALLTLSKVQEPLVIVLLNNGGGSIFKMLPINSYKKKYAEYFETPQYASFAALCRAHKINHTLISRPEQLIPSFETYIERPGVHIFECMTDAEDSMDLRKKMWSFSKQDE